MLALDKKLFLVGHKKSKRTAKVIAVCNIGTKCELHEYTSVVWRDLSTFTANFPFRISFSTLPCLSVIEPRKTKDKARPPLHSFCASLLQVAGVSLTEPLSVWQLLTVMAEHLQCKTNGDLPAGDFSTARGWLLDLYYSRFLGESSNFVCLGNSTKDTAFQKALVSMTQLFSVFSMCFTKEASH